jgi:hypothetical protein
VLVIFKKEDLTMSEYCEGEEEFFEGGEHDYENGELAEDELLEIQEEYRRRRLIESLIGPIVSTVFHVVLIVILAIFITDQVKEPVAEIEVTMEDIIIIEEPPPIVEPELEIEDANVINPVLTTVAVEDVDTNDTALEDTDDDAPSTDDSMIENVVSDVIVSPSAFASPSVYGGRSAAGRAASVTSYGGTKAGQDKLLKAFWWLAKVQNPDGSWGTGAQPAYTGLALLTFLAHGETQASKNFGTTVRKAMQWLVDDPIDTKSSHAYPHAIKTYALAEAYAMTGVSMLEDKMNACVKILIDGQQKGGSYYYNYRTDESIQDLSFAGWNYQALKAAKGAGCEEPGLPEAIYKAIAWLKKNSAGSNTFGYRTKNNIPNSSSKATMRAVGVLCLQLFDKGDAVEIKDELAKISTDDLAKLNWDAAPKGALYGWYYATQAMFQAGDKLWGPWNRKFEKELKDNQHKEGYWEHPGQYHKGPGDALSQKVYATTLCALMLTVYYRYLPSSKGAKGGKAKQRAKVRKKVLEEEGLDVID